MVTMANSEHIQWLLEGVDSWNTRRSNPPYFQPDFGDLYLRAEFSKSGKVLPDLGVSLAGFNLADANFENSSLAYTNFEGANLHQANFKHCDLPYANFTGCNLSLATFDEATLMLANFTGSDLTLASLAAADLERANLECANLKSAILVGASLSLASPCNAKLFPENPDNISPHQHDDSQLVDTCIKDVGALLDGVRVIEELYNGDVRLYFRGESQSEWALSPSIIRDEVVKAALAKYEGEMLVDLATRRPGELNNTTSALAQWVLAQHHGLKTRLLDITRNPLVALFNASREHSQEPGRLHVFAVPPELIKPFNSDSVSVIANFARLSKSSQDILLGTFQERVTHSQHSRAMFYLYQYIQQEKPYFAERINPRLFYQVFVVEPQQTSDRIRPQSSAFLLSAFHDRFERKEILNKNADIPVYAHYMFSVPSKYKTGLMKELARLEITFESLFPGLDSSARAVIDIFRQKVTEVPHS